jgi:hypothetical protein
MLTDSDIEHRLELAFQPHIFKVLSTEGTTHKSLLCNGLSLPVVWDSIDTKDLIKNELLYQKIEKQVMALLGDML